MATFSRRDFLAISAAAAGATMAGLPAAARAAGIERNLIIVLANGGWDTSYSIEPKPGLLTVDAPAGAVQMFGNLPVFTDVSRPNIESFFAAYGDVSTIINGISVRSIAHPSCMKRTLTGTASETNPDIGAIVAHELGRDLPVPYLVLGPTAFSGYLAGSAGRVGTTNQIKALLDPAEMYPPASFVPNAGDEAAIRKFVQARVARESAVRGSTAHNQARIDDFNAALGRGDTLKPYNDALGPRGVALALLDQLTLAADVIQNGVAHTVMTDTGVGWDTHTFNAIQNTYHDELFSALKSFGDLLATRPGKEVGNTLLDETVVVVLSEMTRTPLLNADAGKDHWPYSSALIFGGGVAPNKLVGGTDGDVLGLPVNLETGEIDMVNGSFIQTENVVAALLELTGVDPTSYFPGVAPLRGIIG